MTATKKYCLDYVSRANKAKLEAELQICRLVDIPLTVHPYEQGLILPNHTTKGAGGVINNDGVLVDTEQEVVGAYDVSLDEIEYKDEEVIYIGYMYYAFGHAFTDNLQKLWFLHTNEGKELLNRGVKMVYNVFQGEEMPSYSKRLAELANFNISSAIPVLKPTRFKKIWLPSNSLFRKDKKLYYTATFKTSIEAIKENVLKNVNPQWETYNKVYLSRTTLANKEGHGWQRTRDYGEQAVEDAFVSKGYVALHPENIPLEQQIYIAMTAKHIAATVGSVSHVSIFANANTQMILLNKIDWCYQHQLLADHLAETQVVYVDIHHSMYKIEAWLGPFYMSVTKYLQQFLGLKPQADNFLLDPIFWKYFMRWQRRARRLWWRDVKRRWKKN